VKVVSIDLPELKELEVVASRRIAEAAHSDAGPNRSKQNGTFSSCFNIFIN
jgi:hypothetical protein